MVRLPSKDSSSIELVVSGKAFFFHQTWYTSGAYGHRQPHLLYREVASTIVPQVWFSSWQTLLPPVCSGSGLSYLSIDRSNSLRTARRCATDLDCNCHRDADPTFMLTYHRASAKGRLPCRTLAFGFWTKLLRWSVFLCSPKEGSTAFVNMIHFDLS